MTDRLKGVIVTFQNDVREDDAEAILNAIRMIKGVLSAKPLVSDVNQHMAEQRVRQELGEKLWKVIYPDQGLDKR
jgi:ATP sulfurylase